jgi:hypothetical protein
LRLRVSTVRYHRNTGVVNCIARNPTQREPEPGQLGRYEAHGGLSSLGEYRLPRSIQAEPRMTHYRRASEVSRGGMPRECPDSRSWHSAPPPITARWRLPAEPMPRPVVCVIVASAAVASTTPRWPARCRRVVRDDDWLLGLGIPRFRIWMISECPKRETLRTGCILAEFAINSAQEIIYIGLGPWDSERGKEEE